MPARVTVIVTDPERLLSLKPGEVDVQSLLDPQRSSRHSQNATLRFPPFCPCCLGAAKWQYQLAKKSSTGIHVVQIKIPYCRKCLNHAECVGLAKLPVFKLMVSKKGPECSCDGYAVEWAEYYPSSDRWTFKFQNERYAEMFAKLNEVTQFLTGPDADF